MPAWKCKRCETEVYHPWLGLGDVKCVGLKCPVCEGPLERLWYDWNRLYVVEENRRALILLDKRRKGEKVEITLTEEQLDAALPFYQRSKTNDD